MVLVLPSGPCDYRGLSDLIAIRRGIRNSELNSAFSATALQAPKSMRLGVQLSRLAVIGERSLSMGESKRPASGEVDGRGFAERSRHRHADRSDSAAAYCSSVSGIASGDRAVPPTRSNRNIKSIQHFARQYFMPKHRKKTIPTIEHYFAIYVDTQMSDDIDPISEDEGRRAFFCGFNTCLELIDVLAEISYENPKDGETGLEKLHAEFDKFATEQDCGSTAVNH